MPTKPHVRLVTSASAPSPVTTANLVTAYRRSRQSAKQPLGQLVRHLPDTLTAVCDILLSGFDYRRHITSDAAITCRTLAAMIGSLEDYAEENLRPFAVVPGETRLLEHYRGATEPFQKALLVVAQSSYRASQEINRRMASTKASEIEGGNQ